MRNNFTFCSSIKMKKLERMEGVINLLISENTNNEDLRICTLFKNLLDNFDINIKDIKSNDVIESFADFYEKVLIDYCKKEVLPIKKFECFDFEQTQYVFDKMSEIIDIIGDKYDVRA